MKNDLHIPGIEVFPPSIKTKDGIYGFFGKTNGNNYEPINEYGFLSNMVVIDKPIVYQDIAYYSVENFYVAMKSLSLETRKKISKMDPKKSKVYGGTIKLRSDWENIKYSVLLYGLREKFKLNPYKSRLLSTGEKYIEETNWWNDKYFGVHNGYGHNILGRMLQHVRTELILGRQISFVYSDQISGLIIYLE